VKVLILHQHFKIPQKGGAIRSYYLAKALVEKGIQVVVVTVHNESSYKAESVEGIEVHYLPVPYDNRFGFRKRVFAFYRFVVKSIRFASRQRDADLCYVISTPLTTGLAAMAIRKIYGIPYIFEVGDLWPDAPIQLGFIRNKLLQRMLYRMEKSIYQRASSIVALSPAIEQCIAQKAKGKLIHLVPNMADTSFFEPAKKRAELEEKLQVKGNFVVSYVGALGVANGLHYFIDCAAASQQAELPIRFVLCGDGAMLESLTTYADKKALQNLTIVPFQNRQGVADILNVTDANFICYQPVSILETGSPNKYFDGLAAGKLTIINFGGWIKEEIENERCGIAVNSHDAEDFIRKIRAFVHDPLLLKRYQHAARTLAERRYARRILGEQYYRIVTDFKSGPINK
jgi:glycosyltransferase involved in cell wall biosynthesis